MRIGRPRLKVLSGIQLGRMFSMPGPLDSLRPKGGFGVGSSVRVQVPATLAQIAGFGIGSTGKAISAVSIAESAGFGIGGNSTAQAFSGLLDQYPGAAVAYSMRRLSSTYSGPLVTIRRGNDNAEKDFYPDASQELSLTSTDGAGTDLNTWIGSENGFIKTWYDQSGNANNAEQLTASAQAQIINSGALNTNNSKAALNTNGANNYFVFDSFATNGMALLAVGNNTAYGTIISGGDDVSNRFDYGPRIINSYRYFVAVSGANDTLDSGTNVLSNYLFEAYKDAGTFGYTYLNASVESSGTMAYNLQSYTNTNKLFTRNFGGGNSDYIAGVWNEILIFPTDQTANRTAIETNINNFYSIY